MAQSVESHAVSSLLCTEDKNSILEDDSCVVEDFGGGFGLPIQSEECLGLMVKKERQHMSTVDYLKRLRRGDLELAARKQAIGCIVKAYSCFGFEPLCFYLSINYLDRFLSASQLPKNEAWNMELLATACLSIAAKVEESEVPPSLESQGKTMELHVLKALSWRMHAVTPFSFIDYFLDKINNDESTSRLLIFPSIQLILTSVKGIDFLEFKPSEIAAAVAITVVGGMKPVVVEKAISSIAKLVSKERVVKCVELIEDVLMVGGSMQDANATILCMPQSPVGVLDAACFSQSTAESSPSSSQNTPHAKRRRLI